MNDNDLQLIHSLLMNIDFLTGCYLVPSVKTYIPQAMCNAKKLEVKFENVFALTVRSYYFCLSRILTSWLRKNKGNFFKDFFLKIQCNFLLFETNCSLFSGPTFLYHHSPKI